MTFDEYLRRRRIDPTAFAAAEPARAAEWEQMYGQMHPDSFLLLVKQVINEVRRRYHLAEAPPPPAPAEGTPRPSGRRARPIGPLTEIPVLDPTAPLADPAELLATTPAPATPPPASSEGAAEMLPAPPRPRPRAVIRRPEAPAETSVEGSETAASEPPTETESGIFRPATTGSAVPSEPLVPPVTPETPGPDVPEAAPPKPVRPRPIIRRSPPAAGEQPAD